MEIRKIQDRELPFAVKLRIECEDKDFPDVVPPGSIKYEDELNFITSWLNDLECNDIRRVYCAIDGTNFIGFIGASLAEEEDCEKAIELNYLFVDSNYRGQSVGLKLMKTIVDEYTEYDIEKVIVYNYNNCPSNKFYIRLGGKVIKQITQQPKDRPELVDIFCWDIHQLQNTLNEIIDRFSE